MNVSDKLVHTLAYFLLALNWFLVFKNKGNELSVKLFVFGLVFLYGIIIEVSQGCLTVNRQFELKDLGANFIGIVLAFLFFNYFLQKKVFI